MDLATGNATSTDAEAPYGRKADGSPRKRPGRPPVVKARTRRSRAKLTPVPEPAVSTKDAAELTGTDKVRADLIELRDGIQRQLDAVNGAIEALS